MKSQLIKATVTALTATAALTLVSCSSSLPPLPPQPVQAPVAPAPAAPSLVEVGMLMETASGIVTVQSIDAATRTLTLQRADGDIVLFKAGPDVRRFNQIKVGDQIMTTLTDNATLFLVKGKVSEGAAAAQAVVRTPEGQNLGGIVLNAININAKVLDVDRDNRRLLLQYTPTKTRSVPVRSDADLSQVSVGDTILVRGTQSLSIMVANP
jgi:hypothetical protein